MFFSSSTFFLSIIIVLTVLVSGCGTTAPAAPPTPVTIKEKPTEAVAMATVAPSPTEQVMSPTQPAVKPTDAAMAATPTSPAPATAMATPTEAAITASEQPNKYGWKQITAENAPAPRYDHTLTLDYDQQRLILFGGREGGQVFGDTWIYDLKSSQWREVKGLAPSARFGLASAYDPSRKAVFIFGGQKEGFYNDTWMFETVSETWSEVQTPDPKPDIRYGHGVTLDTQNDRLVVSHGFARDGRHDDTWALDLKTNIWSNLTPSGDKPLKRCLTDIAYAPSSDSVYLFGGCSSGFGPCPQGDLWSFDLKSDTWIELKPSGEAPSARDNPSMVVDSKTGQLILFGGRGNGAMDDLWVYDPARNGWSEISFEGPGARKSHDAVYDPSNHRVFLFGGTNGSSALNDLWVLEL